MEHVMATVRVYVKGTQAEFDDLFIKANVRFGEYKDGKWVVDIRIPDVNVKQNPYRYYRITTIRGLIKKLESNGHLSEQLLVRKCIY